MTQARTQLLKRLVQTAEGLPDDKLSEIVDFAEFLDWKQDGVQKQEPERGSPAAILRALDRGGLQFEPGELDELLADIEQSRLKDLEDDDRLSP